MFTFIKKNLQIWMRLSTFANENERNLIDMCTFKIYIINNHFRVHFGELLHFLLFLSILSYLCNKSPLKSGRIELKVT